MVYTYSTTLDFTQDGKQHQAVKTWQTTVRYRKGEQVIFRGLFTMQIHQIAWGAVSGTGEVEFADPPTITGGLSASMMAMGWVVTTVAEQD